jgi:hypothetical protein
MGDLDLDTRTGWPADLRFLLDRYPRASWYPRAAWPSQPNLGPLSRSWLEHHDYFRAFGRGPLTGARQYREAAASPTEFRQMYGPRLRYFLLVLEGHHRIEDDYYFPVFRAAEPRLAPGFEALERDHATIRADIAEVGKAATAFLAADDIDAARAAGTFYGGHADRLWTALTQHFDDEEDLIIPLILERTEEALGIG